MTNNRYRTRLGTANIMWSLEASIGRRGFTGIRAVSWVSTFAGWRSEKAARSRRVI